VTAWGCEDVVVAYGGRTGLDGVTLRVEPGTVTVVVGGDGAGKTSLLATLVGARRPRSGHVRRPPSGRIGLLPSTGGSWGDLTVDENLAFAAGAYGVPEGERGDRIDGLVTRMALAGARDRLGAQLSGGMRQKLGLAMALVHRPELLVLDEPTTGVDPVSRAELWRLIAAAAADGAAVVVATTYLDEAERAGQVVLLDRGRVLARGSVDEIVAGVPGTIVVGERRIDGGWRRGTGWRAWRPAGDVPTGTHAVDPELEDAVMVTLLEREAAA
jgi:ABC-2 type transport system ATP-binding protein